MLILYQQRFIVTCVTASTHQHVTRVCFKNKLSDASSSFPRFFNTEKTHNFLTWITFCLQAQFPLRIHWKFFESFFFQHAITTSSWYSQWWWWLCLKHDSIIKCSLRSKGMCRLRGVSVAEGSCSPHFLLTIKKIEKQGGKSNSSVWKRNFKWVESEHLSTRLIKHIWISRADATFAVMNAICLWFALESNEEEILNLGFLSSIKTSLWSWLTWGRTKSRSFLTKKDQITKDKLISAHTFSVSHFFLDAC